MTTTHEPSIIYLQIIGAYIAREKGVRVGLIPPRSQSEIDAFEKMINSPKFNEFYEEILQTNRGF